MGAEPVRPENRIIVRLLQRCVSEVEAIQWLLRQHCRKALLTFVHIPCALDMSVFLLHLLLVFKLALHSCSAVSSLQMPHR